LAGRRGEVVGKNPVCVATAAGRRRKDGDIVLMEDVAQMAPMLILAGLTVGWVAEAARRAGGHGLLSDLVLGLVGSLVVGGLVRVVISSDIGMVAMLAIGGGGAVLAIMAQRTVWKSTLARA
jgi:uncharacterized membrane protein YeaQ/YmgE (transglycosylase-associated protein family)